jgi:excisionase family DNA binding protein
MNTPKQKAGLPAGSKRLDPPIVPRLLTVAEVSEATGFERQTIYLWIAQRRLPVVRLGRSVRVAANALAEMIAEATTPARERGER